ncbi:NAD-dependent epimerase/dehydratase family protein [Lactococcus hodotermopsidis]|nr:NAD-dependent epimerase/dehydratase family protein [Lactococcus hodotermopsidis]
MQKEKVLLLGANGFLGSHVTDALIAEGFSVRAMDMFSDFKNARFNPSVDIEMVSGNFLNQADVEEAIGGVDYVIHLVTTTNPATAESDPLIDIDTNIRGSVELFQKIVANGKIKKIIYSSSGGTVYGDQDVNHPISELEHTWPVSPYGIGKLTIENYLHYFDKKFVQPYTVFRIANPYGERQPKVRKQGVIPIFMDKILNDEPITVLGDGEMVRDYIYVKDVAQVIAKSLKKELQHSIYNLGSGSGHSVNEIVAEIEKATGKKAKIDYKPAPSTFVNFSVLDNTRCAKEFPEVTLTSLDIGIKHLIREIESE